MPWSEPTFFWNKKNPNCFMCIAMFSHADGRNDMICSVLTPLAMSEGATEDSVEENLLKSCERAISEGTTANIFAERGFL